MTWTQLPKLPARSNPCVCCPTIPDHAPLDKLIVVGFGDARVTRDGETLLDGEAYAQRTGNFMTFRDAERIASVVPDHDWRVVLNGPLHGETYQRHGPDDWWLVETNNGFA